MRTQAIQPLFSLIFPLPCNSQAQNNANWGGLSKDILLKKKLKKYLGSYKGDAEALGRGDKRYYMFVRSNS